MGCQQKPGDGIMRRRTIEPLAIGLFLILVITEFAGGWMAEWATYMRPALAPNESRVVFECCRNFEEPECGDSLMENEIFVVDVNTKELKPLTFDIESFWLSSDKSKVLIRTFYGLYLLDLHKKSSPKEIFSRFHSHGFDSRNSPILNVSWAPDGKKFLFIRAIGFDGKRVSSIFDAETCEETPLNVDLFPCALTWHPYGGAIFYDQSGDVNSLNLTTGKSDLILSGFPDDPCHNPIISPDGEKVIYRLSQFFKIRTIGYRDRKIFAQWVEFPEWASKELKESIWRDHKELIKEMQYVLLDGPISDLQFVWSQDGQRILIKDKDEIWLYTLSDSSFLPIHCDSNTITEIVWHPNQKEIYFVSQHREDTNQDGIINSRDKTFGNLAVFSFEANSSKAILSGLESLRNLVFSSDGLFLAYETAGNIWILNVSTLQTYSLTTSGGTRANWLAGDEAILFENENSLYTVGKNGENLIRLTIAKGREPVWLSDSEIAIETGRGTWKIALDKLEAAEVIDTLKLIPRSKGKKYDVYVTDDRFGSQPWIVSEIWVNDIQTSKSFIIKEAWRNW
jgi:Tol biopolymer transport system component